MKHYLLLFSFALLTCLGAGAQIPWDQYITGYTGSPDDRRVIIAIATKETNTAFTSYDADMKSSLVSLSRSKERANAITSFSQVFDSSQAHFIARNINRQQAGAYEFRILRDMDQVVLPWRPITQFAEANAHNGHESFAYLGGYRTERGHSLLVDIRRKGSDSILSSALVSWNNTRPQLTNIFLPSELPLFLKKLRSTSWDEKDTAEIAKWQARYEKEELDTASGLPGKLELGPEENNVIFYLNATIRRATDLQYQVLRDGEVFSDWKDNDFDDGFIWLKDLPPGDYQLKMRYIIQPENITTYPFLIKPRWDQTLTFKLIAGGLIAAFFGFLLLLYHLRRQRQKLRRTKAERDKVETELRSLYSQLNPHFIFNALTSIQGLVNRGETEKANHYLSTFSRLLRESLVNSEKDRVVLSTELKTLETYLQLEQLRFGFRYVIDVEEGLSVTLVEIPSLLLQPLLENAIKHGVSALQEKGKILLRFSREGDGLVARVSDNGEGFDAAAATNGFGLKLTRERIRLLNEADYERPVSLAIEAGKEGGTTILVHFKNWL